MKTILLIGFKKALPAVLLITTSFIAYAQKQPQTQDVSVRAPADVKIDGKHTEWENPFLKDGNGYYLSAYNSSSRYYYTIANDDNNLYLVLRGLGTAAAQKVFDGGLVILISHTAGKKPKPGAAGNVAITFPVKQDEKTSDYIMGPVFSLNSVLPETPETHPKVDSIVKEVNKRIAVNLKEIWITGVKEIPDSVVSIYNELGIKAAMQFAKRMPMIEIAIPLKYLGLDINNPAKFSYDIRLDGLTLSPDIQKDPGTDINAMYGISPTDFWGEYLLAKKLP